LDDELKEITKSFKPLINSSRLLVRPLRSVYAKNKLTGKNIFHYVNPNTENNHWFVDNLRNEDSYFLMDNGISHKQSKQLFEITLPYFSNIDLKTLNKILEDENDLLSSFRINLQKVITEANTNFKSIEEIRKDLLNPEIDKINRKFKVIQNAHKLTTIGLVGTFSLSFVIAYYSHYDLMKLITPNLFIGGMIASNNNYFQKIDDLKDTNFFLLWKIKKHRK
jgi:predicted transcriptional regulator